MVIQRSPRPPWRSLRTIPGAGERSADQRGNHGLERLLEVFAQQLREPVDVRERRVAGGDLPEMLVHIAVLVTGT
jgi:hypothetical protein